MKTAINMLALALGAALSATAPAMAADAALIAAAKKEGQLTWYTTQIVNQFARPAADAFQKKYGIRVNYIRADSNEVTLRIQNEGKAGRVQADVFDGTGATAALKKDKLVAKYIPQSADRLPARFKDKEGYWVATNLYVLTPAFNTDLVKKGTQPKTFADLLDPKWSGKIAWNANTTPSGSAGFAGVVLAHMGQQKGMDYLRKLSGQKIVGMRASARQVLDQVIAGEYAIALNIFNNHAVISASKGAPVEWIPMEPALAVFSCLSLTEGAPNPNAGKLFIDFLMSEEGQKLYRAADYLPVDPAVPPKDPALRPGDKTFDAIFMTPEEVFDNLPKWGEVTKDLFR